MTTIFERHFDVVTLYEEPIVQEEKRSAKPVRPIDEIVGRWMEEFNAGITARDSDAIAALFQEDGIHIFLIRSFFLFFLTCPFSFI